MVNFKFFAKIINLSFNSFSVGIFNIEIGFRRANIVFGDHLQALEIIGASYGNTSWFRSFDAVFLP